MDIKRITLGDHAELLPSIARCYQDVFAHYPWGEWRKCARPGCKEHWGIEGQDGLEKIGNEHCSLPVKEYWPLDVVTADLEKDMGREGVIFWVTILSGEVVGFCYGYPVEAKDFNQLLAMEKEGLKLEDVTAAFHSRYGNAQSAMYLDDIGVMKIHEDNGFGGRMRRSWTLDVAQAGATHSILRTHRRTRRAYEWYEKGGYDVFARYEKDPLSRVVMGASMETLLQRMRH